MLIEDRGATIEDRGAMIEDLGATIEDRGAVAFLVPYSDTKKKTRLRIRSPNVSCARDGKAHSAKAS